ncbi:hypothetical protein ACFL0Q_07415 [Thermodesulfobacteriota bacterium]
MDDHSSYEEKVMTALRKSGAKSSCEVCSGNDWKLLDKPVALVCTEPDVPLSLPSPHLPAAATICVKCGNVRLLALGALGILDH